MIRRRERATKNAAEYRGTLEREGTIARKKRADLVVLDANPLTDIANLQHIHAVVQGARVYTRAELDKLLASAREAAK